jgi:Helicase associated domain
MKPMRKPQSKRWTDQFNKLAEFKTDNGHCNVASSCTWDPELGKWICNQRERHRKGLLSKRRVQMLKDLGFQFDRHNDRWESRYCELIEFKEVHGHCNVPDSWPENLKLARWVMTQRQMYRKGKLSQNRFRRLEAIGFIWCRQEYAWNEMYQRLVSYLKAHGDGTVCLELKGDPQLGSWVVKQRYRKKKGLLSKERVRKLDGIGMRW